MPLYHSQGRTLHYTIENNAFPHDMLFVHGNLASTRWWQPTIQFLEKKRTTEMQGRMVAVDWPGCGESMAPSSPGDLSMESLANDHIALARAAGLSDICLVGHSTGGLIALMMLKLAPELFTKAVLLNPVSATGIRLEPSMLEAFEKMSQDRHMVELVLGGTIYGRDTSEPFIQKLIDDGFGVDKLVWTEIPKHLSNIDIRLDLKHIKQPVLVMHGEHDQVLPVEGSKEIAKLLPHAQFELLKGRGHCPNVEDPGMFAAKLENFFA